MSICNFVAAVALLLGAEPGEDQSCAADEKERVRESAERVLEMAHRFEFFADAEQKRKLELQPKSVLTYSNPVQGEVYGSVFVWTHFGRPQVLGAIFDFRSEKRMDSEFHVLAGGSTQAARDGKAFLSLDAPGIEFQSVADAPPPAASAAGTVARCATWRGNSRSNAIIRCRNGNSCGCSAQPIYRYSSAAANVVDGAIFVYVEGTDPEAYLLLEASGDEKPVCGSPSPG